MKLFKRLFGKKEKKTIIPFPTSNTNNDTSYTIFPIMWDTTDYSSHDSGGNDYCGGSDSCDSSSCGCD